MAETFELRVGGSAVIAGSGLTVTFQKVSGDSRCPQRTTCVWAGDAIVLLSVTRDGQEAVTLELHTNLSMKKDEAPYDGLTVKLIELKPYPVGDERIIADRYVVALRVGQ
jgi:hypothetical protein